MDINSFASGLCLLTAFSILFLGCDTVRPTTSGRESTSTPAAEPLVKDVSSSLERSRRKLVQKVEDVSLPAHGSLEAIQFVNANRGWLVSESELFTTVNGGGDWQPITIPLPSDAKRITAAFFSKGHPGWLALGRCGPNEFCDSYRLWLMVTNDDGKTWETRLEQQDVEVNSIFFRDDQSGWIAGTRFKNPSPFAPLVLKTSDGGRDWDDVSGGIRSSLANQKDQMRSPTHDQAEQVFLGPKGSLVVATGRLRLFSSTDDGHRWNEIASLQDEQPQTGMVSLGVQGDKYWLAGGTMGEEGIWSSLARQQSDRSWLRYRINGVYLKHVYFIDENKILACGTLSQISGLAGSAPGGVVLGSLDGGKSWTIIHQDPKLERFNFLTADQSGRVWLAGTGGVLLRLGLLSDIVAALQKNS